MSKVKNQTSVAANLVPEVVVENTVETVVEETLVVEVPKTAAEVIAEMKQQLKAQAEAAMKAKLEIAEKMKQLKAEALELKLKTKEAELEMQTAAAAERAQKLHDAMAAKGLVQKENMTLRIKELLLAGFTLDQIEAETGYARKSISDRIWNIEKALGLR